MPSQIAYAASLAAGWRGQLLDLLFPRRCVSCHRIGALFCSQCLGSIHYVQPPFCLRCNQGLTTQGGTCFRCRAYPLHLAQIRAVAYHEGALREAIHAFKYDGQRDLAAPLALLLYGHLQKSELKVDLITSVPLFPDRQRERGYNQAGLLARALAARANLPYIDGLQRLRATQDQIGLDIAARHENMKGAFFADPQTYRGRSVLVVDDVCTTGATLDGCAVALDAQGARAIYGMTVARPR